MKTSTQTTLVHLRTWTDSGTFTLTDMTNAGKRGKVCRTLRFSGGHACWSDGVGNLAAHHSLQIISMVEEAVATETFDTIRERVRDMVATARSEGVPADYLTSYDEKVRGIDAPRLTLTAGVDGVWSASADDDGVSLADLNDVNEWRECTHGQAETRAYDLARKVWGQVQAATTRHEASRILREAGCKLHGYCGLD